MRLARLGVSLPSFSRYLCRWRPFNGNALVLGKLFDSFNSLELSSYAGIRWSFDT